MQPAQQQHLKGALGTCLRMSRLRLHGPPVPHPLLPCPGLPPPPARLQVNQHDTLAVFKAASKEDFKDVIALLPENTPLPASDKMTYLLARLIVSRPCHAGPVPCRAMDSWARPGISPCHAIRRHATHVHGAMQPMMQQGCGSDLPCPALPSKAVGASHMRGAWTWWTSRMACGEPARQGPAAPCTRTRAGTCRWRRRSAARTHRCGAAAACAQRRRR